MSETATHTPGPWEAYFVSSAGWSVRMAQPRDGYDRPDPICSMAWWQFDKPGIIDNDISGANARLIAAAPELLEACDQLIRWVAKGSGPSCEAIRFAKAAIAKATGTAPVPS